MAPIVYAKSLPLKLNKWFFFKRSLSLGPIEMKTEFLFHILLHKTLFRKKKTIIVMKRVPRDTDAADSVAHTKSGHKIGNEQ